MKATIKRLADVTITITKGTTPTSLGYQFADGGVGFLRVQNISGGTVNFEVDTLFIDEDVHGSLSRSQIRPGDVLVSIAGTIGRAGVVPAHAPSLNCNQAVAIVRTSEAVHQSYLRHWLESTDAQGQMRSAAVTGTIQNLSLSQLGQLQIPLPPLPEQRRIAAILDQADAIRAKRREALAQFDRLTQAIFVEMFGDPVSNPKGWPVVKLGEVGTLDRGVSKHRPRNDPKLLGGAYPLIQTGDVANCDSYIDTYDSTYSDFGLKQSKLWPAGTLCITIAANIAKTGILKIDACFPDSVVGFRAASDATVEYVRVWLSFLQKMLEDAAPESAQKNINLAILRDLDVPLPPITQQETFHAVLMKQNAVRADLVVGQIELDALFTSLQHRAFRGEL